jgi:hypothetical protein
MQQATRAAESASVCGGGGGVGFGGGGGGTNVARGSAMGKRERVVEEIVGRQKERGPPTCT